MACVTPQPKSSVSSHRLGVWAKYHIISLCPKQKANACVKIPPRGPCLLVRKSGQDSTGGVTPRALYTHT